MQYISEKKQRVYGIAISYAIIGIQIITAVVYTPIILKNLGQSEYGVYSLAISCLSYLTLFDGGMNAAFVRFYVQIRTKKKEELPKLNGIFLKMFLLLAIAAFILGMLLVLFSENVFGSNINAEEYSVMKTCLYLLPGYAFFTVINCIFNSFIIANERFVFAKVSNLFFAIFTPIIIIPFLLLGFGAETVIAVKFIMEVLVFMLNIFFSFRVLKIRFDLRGNDNKLLKNIAAFAGTIVIQGIMDQLNWQIDKFILARVSNVSEISIYSIGAAFNEQYIAFATAFSGVFIAKTNRLTALGKSDEINSMFQRTSRILSFLVFWIMTAYIIFGKAFILRWAGDEYENSYLVGLLVMLPMTFALTQGLAQDISRAKNKHKILILISFFVCFINMLISIPLARLFGAVGSAVGTFLSEVVITFGVKTVYYQKFVELDMKKYYREMFLNLKGLVLPGILVLLLLRLHMVRATYESIIICGILYTVTYCMSMWLFVINEEEKCMSREIFGRLKGLWESRRRM